MNTINIVGLGPGSREFITPAALECVKNSDVIIGGLRNLKSLNTSGKMTISITNNLEDVVLFVRNNYHTKTISIVASGDPGFFGILAFFLKRFAREELNVIPGVSSMQYMFAKLGKTWEDAYLGSIHGRDDEISEAASKYKKAVYMTDDKRSYRYIAEKLTEHGFGERMMYIGINLSYNDEKIISDKAKRIAAIEDIYKLCVVVVTDEE